MVPTLPASAGALLGGVSTSEVAPPWHDPKRYGWLLSLLMPIAVGLAPLAHMYTGEAAWLLAPVVASYVGIPLVDFFLGEDSSNPPESAVPALERDVYYQLVSWAMVPVSACAFAFSSWFVTSRELPLHGVVAVALSTGIVGGYLISLAHEMGHRHGAEREAATAVLAVTGYGHFTLEHNAGHHKHVATFADPASSRMGESIYAFVLREMPGGFLRAWALERERLGEGAALWSVSQNRVLRPLAFTAAFWGAIVLACGLGALPFLCAAAFWANWQLTSANYIEHYGLLRRPTGPKGEPETCLPCHSWNSNHLFSNLVTLHLQRHSDHHAHARRRFQSLRHFDSAPQLPGGYATMFVIAWIPPLWYYVMDKRLIAAVGGDVSKINFQPSERERLVRKHSLGAEAAKAK